MIDGSETQKRCLNIVCVLLKGTVTAMYTRVLPSQSTC